VPERSITITSEFRLSGALQIALVSMTELEPTDGGTRFLLRTRAIVLHEVRQTA
jgi:hypothetical protein